MKKRVMLLLLAFMMLLSGCSNEEPNTQNEITNYEGVANEITFSSDIDGISLDDLKEVEYESFPYFYQEDYSAKFGDSTIADTGNLVTCLSMVESYYEKVEVTPDLFIEKHSELCENGTESLNSSQISNFIEELGLGCVKEEFDLKMASDSLKTLHGCIIVFIPHNSVYGEGGSYLLITGIYEDKFIVHDPVKESMNRNKCVNTETDDIIYNATVLTASASDSSSMWIIY